ncbi:type II secretion system protein F [Aestuariivirga litoralis]|uniref:Type II secretion system protein F n=1 Tax=Aestuariivirga litoralis TaxID=2650924 RepID=A0A2W2B513_9HYPH|nr:type II secretion system F family protein [Aestuariivirga litoralis]PZF75178.1 type II secretion system protein F [Aestuariivirga litoralis]
MDTGFFIRMTFYVCSALALIFLAEALYLGVLAPMRSRRAINRRLKVQNDVSGGEQAMLRLKAERGIKGDVAVMGGLRKMLIQSGLSLTLARFLTIMVLASTALVTGLLVLTTLPAAGSIAIGLLVGMGLPFLVVRHIRNRRRTEFQTQLPDALDVVVRSLRSGHPVPTALMLVGREMADPIGTEFGLTTDELTYGLDLPSALQNLSNRVGVADMSLLVTAVSLQSSAGGNLGEVLENLSRVLRERFQLKRKVRSLSAEGRFSAYGLTILPVAIALAIYFPNPKYYTDVWHLPIFQLVMGALIVWKIIGDIMIYKMINFKY